MDEQKQNEVAVAHPELHQVEVQWRLTERQALALSKSGEAIPKAFRNNPADILAVWMLGDELGIPRMAMLRGAYVINGKPQLSGDLLMAVALQSGCKVHERIAETVDGLEAEDATGTGLEAVCEVQRPDGQSFTGVYTSHDAQRAGLWGSSEVWRKYPRRMLQMRARGFALRDAIPDKLAGVYAPGEIIDVTPQEVSE